MAPSARSLILDLLSTLPQGGDRGAMPVGALVAAGELFGIAGGSVRVALTRLLAAGRIERDARGQYRMGPGAEPVLRQVRSWRRLDRATTAWDGRWLAVQLGPGTGRGARRHSQRALRFLGLEALTPGLFVRPANLAGGVDATRGALASLGLEPAALVFTLGDLDAETDRRARALWDGPALRARYRASHAALERSLAELDALPREAAQVESFLVGGRVIQQLVLDPLLPDEILPTDARDALVALLRRYDDAGRACWADFLANWGVLQRRAPADTRIAAGVENLSPA